MILNLLIFFAVILAAFICYFLGLIAKFFELKSNNGVNHISFMAGSSVFLAGIITSMDIWPIIVYEFISPVMVISGGLWLLFLVITLYRRMMSVNKSSG